MNRITRFEAGQSAFARALLDANVALPDGITTARGEPDAARFAVYRNNVFVSLTGVLAKRFPVVARLVGGDFFAGMARIYAGMERPSSPLMFRYGDGFGDFIAGFEPAKSLPYLADIARLEAAWTRAYHATDEPPLAIDQLAGLPPEMLGSIRLAPHTSATVLQSRFPAGSIWSAHQGETVTPVRSAQAECVLVVRPSQDVAVHILPRCDAPFAVALFAGSTMAQAAEVAAIDNGNFSFGAALVGLVSLGAFSAIKQEDKPT